MEGKVLQEFGRVFGDGKNWVVGVLWKVEKETETIPHKQWHCGRRAGPLSRTLFWGEGKKQGDSGERAGFRAANV